MDLVGNLQHEEGENGQPKPFGQTAGGQKKKMIFRCAKWHGTRETERPAVFLGDVLHIHGKQGESQPQKSDVSMSP